METQRIQNSQTNLEKNKTRHITLPDFQIYYKATINKTVWYQHKDRHRNQYNGKRSPKANSHIYSHLVFNKDTKNT